MKTRISSNEKLSKLFNEQSQHHAKGNNMFFDGNTLYSYGYHYPLALFIEPNTVLINNSGWGNATAKHMRHAFRATINRKQILSSHIELRQVYAELVELERKLLRARKPEIYTKQIMHLYKQFSNNMKYLNGFYIKVKDMFGGTRFEHVPYINANEKQIELLDTINSIYENAICYILETQSI